jgi:hypothetical protein
MQEGKRGRAGQAYHREESTWTTWRSESCIRDLACLVHSDCHGFYLRQNPRNDRREGKDARAKNAGGGRRVRHAHHFLLGQTRTSATQVNWNLSHMFGQVVGFRDLAD